jgi:hypothetical protein
MTVKLTNFSGPWPTGPNFEYACFANITHLHLYDEYEDWSIYTGFEHLHSLTHLALACCSPASLAIVMSKLPVLEYVTLCYYSNDYGHPAVNRTIPMEVYGINVVWVKGLTVADWECGATGGTDFWDIVEREVARRPAKVVRESNTDQIAPTSIMSVEPQNPLQLATSAK